METRARYALIGLFMLAVVAAGFAFVYWLENKGGFGARDNYRVKFEGSVSGLMVGSSVLFNGLRVGEVTGLYLDPSTPNQVIAAIAVEHNTPVRDDTKVSIEQQGLTGGAALTLRGGTGTEPVAAQGGEPALLVAEPNAGQDWTDAARQAFQSVQTVLDENSKSLHSAIDNIDTFAGALARNSDKVDGILAGLEKMTGGSGGGAKQPLYDLALPQDLPAAPETAPTWQVVVPEPSTLMGINTDKILVQPAEGEVSELPDAKWTDNLPVLVQSKVVQSFENAGFAKSVSRPRDNVTGGYQLLLDIRQFAVSTGSPAEAKVAFVAKLVDPDGKILGAQDFKASAAANGSDAKAYVAALNDAFGKFVPELLKWTTTTLDNAPPPAPPAEEPQEPASPDAGQSGNAEPEMPPMPEAPSDGDNSQ